MYTVTTQKSEDVDYVVAYEGRSCISGKPEIRPYSLAFAEQVPTREAAEKWFETVKQDMHEHYLELQESWKGRDQMAELGRVIEDDSLTAQLMTVAEFEAAQRDQILGEGNKLQLVTRAEFWDKLEVLPPEKWVREDGFETFCMSEHLTGSFTAQYACCRMLIGADTYNVYATRTVDASDKSTWITRSEIAEAIERGERPDYSFSMSDIYEHLNNYVPSKRKDAVRSVMESRWYENEWVRFEMHTVAEIEDDDGVGHCERLVDISPEFLNGGAWDSVFFTIYVYHKDGACWVLEDFTSRSKAKSALNSLNETLLADKLPADF